MLKVIVADDEYFARKALVKMLENMTLPIEICGDCENGLDVAELLKTCSAEFVITDIKIPEMDGLKLSEYIKTQGLDTDIIIETGYADFGYARTAIRYGVKEYLMKPLNEKELREAIQNVIQERLKRSGFSGTPARNRERSQKHADKENTAMIDELLDYLERNYFDDISLDELAKEKYFVSSSYLSRLFKSCTGQNFMKYLIELRMEKAKNFLEYSEMDISEIAACTGYNNPSHFTQTFRRYYGMSPKEYRKRLELG